ncbi:MAG: amidohydrolase family protein [Thermoguttaceae bacterium]
MTTPSCPTSHQAAGRITLKARYVFPVASEPIPDGSVTIEAGRIMAVGKTTGKTEDLGNVAILPGLINAHTHLDLSDLDQPLGRPGLRMVDWIRLVIEHRRNNPLAPRLAVRRGLEESIRFGTTTLGDMVQPDWPYEEVQRAAMGVAAFLELIAPLSERVAAAEQLAVEHIRPPAGKQPAAPGTPFPGLSPHAPYSVHPRLLERLVSLSSTARVPLAMHLAESPEELELLRTGGGPFRELLDELNAWQADSFHPGGRPLDYLRMLLDAHRVLIIHGNYLDDEEIALLGANADCMSVIYCPRTHQRFAHASYALEKMLTAGVQVALGTDSRASTPDLSVLAELRLAAREHPSVAGEVILQLATLRAAAALGLAGRIGTLEPGKQADLTIVSLPDHTTTDPHELLFESDSPVTGRWWCGKKA